MDKDSEIAGIADRGEARTEGVLRTHTFTAGRLLLREQIQTRLINTK